MVVGASGALILTDRDPGHTPTVLITAVVALGVAVLTAWTTDQRQEKQLTHERAALAQTHRHERVSADLRELREVLDHALAVLVRLGDIYRALAWAIATDDGNPEFEQRWEAQGDEVSTEWTRLELRLGRDHSVLEAYVEAYKTVHDAIDTTRQAAKQEIDPVTKRNRITTITNSAMIEFRQGIGDFSEKARMLVGTADEIMAKTRTGF